MRDIDPDDSMHFERTLMLFFGDAAYQTAGQAATPKHRRFWLKRVLRLVMKCIDKIDTTPRHKQLMMKHVEGALKEMGTIGQPTWKFVYYLVALIGRLLGFDYQKGSRLHTVSYWQTRQQEFNSVIQAGGDGMQQYRDEEDAVSIRQGVVQSLKSQGMSDFKVALVLNTTEYEIQQLRRNTHRRLRKTAN